jgi:hypothetical protein
MQRWRSVNWILKWGNIIFYFNNKSQLRFFIFILTFFLFGCKASPKHEDRKIERSFYFWKSNFKLSDTEKQTLDTLKIKTLYLKFFDVTWDDVSSSAIPIAQLRINDSGYLRKSSLQIIPTIFITNECIFKIDSSQTKQLAEKIFNLTKKIIANNSLQNVHEIQIDCDWTASTKEKYFAILDELQLLDKTINLSATIRLHQIKYLDRTGVPPVKMGMLMCYNMGNLTNIETENSILEIKELQKYIGNLQHYPLHLDVALPLFDWKVLFRDGKFKSLINDLPDNILNTSLFKKNVNTFKVLKDSIVLGYDFKSGDILRKEECKYNIILRAAKLISEKITNINIRVSLYHLDTITLKKYSTYEMENIFNAMR